MILNILKKIFLFNGLNFTRIAFGIFVLNSLFVAGTVAAEPAASSSPPAEFNINLMVCIRDENDQPAVEKTKDGNISPISFVITGGARIIKPKSDSNACSVIDSTIKFTAVKEYVIMVSHQNQNGVRMAIRQFDPGLFKTGTKTTPSTINIKLKDGVSVFDKNGDEVFYNKISPTVGKTEPQTPGSQNDSDGNANANSAGSQPTELKATSSFWDGAISFINLAGIIMICVLCFLILRRPTLAPESDKNLLEKRDFESLANAHKDSIISAIKAKSFEVVVAAPEVKPGQSLTDGIPKPEPEPVQGIGEEALLLKSQNQPSVNAADPNLTSVSPDLQSAAQSYYLKFKGGAPIPHIELQPTGESSPEHLLGNQGIKLSEQVGGKYIAFPTADKPDETWVFPSPTLWFSETVFSLVFPELTRENFEAGNITPKKAVKQNNSQIWLIQ